MNIEGITLSLLLHTKDREKALEYYSELRSDYFSAQFGDMLKHIRSFYEEKGFVPNFGELEIYRARDKKILNGLASLKLIPTEDIDISVAIEELANQHAQNTTLDLIDEVLENLSIMDREDLLNKLGNIPIKLEEKMANTNNVFSISQVPIFKSSDDTIGEKVIGGVCDEWDYVSGGYFKQQLILLGGRRGSGKSIVCANMAASQYKQGNIAVYFTIEMTARETFERILCCLAGIDIEKLLKKELTAKQLLSLCETMAEMFVDGDKVLERHVQEGVILDPEKFQDDLYSSCKEREDRKIIIVDDRELSIATIDTKLSTYKSKYGDKLGLVCVDYLNQIVLDSSADMYDWKPQIVVSKSLKNMARKYDIALVTPYQIDAEGKARFAQGILDAADVAQLLLVEDKSDGLLHFITDKARSTTDQGRHAVSIDWNTLTIDPKPVVIDDNEVDEETESNSDLGLGL